MVNMIIHKSELCGISVTEPKLLIEVQSYLNGKHDHP